MKNITHKRWSIFYVSITLFTLLSTFSINFIVDPYQQYRKASFYTFTIQDQRYLNAGLIKNYEYDSILLGTSMVENFNANDIEDILNFKKVIKLPVQGAALYEEMATLKLALETKNIKNILFGLDISSFSSTQYEAKYNSRFPFYLYDKDISNDTTYLINKDILNKSFKSIQNRYDESQIEENLNTIYNWQEIFKDDFKVENIKKDYIDHINKIKKSDFNNYNFVKFKENFDEQLMPIIRANRDINFYLFYPPYSMFTYKLMRKMNYFDDYIRFKTYIFKKLKKYKNIKIYDFQIAKKITHNLDNYKDISHYSSKINYSMLKYIKKEKYLVTDDNIKDYTIKFKKYLDDYNFKGID